MSKSISSDQTHPETIIDHNIPSNISLKKKKKNRILALKLRSHATVIQSHWRGAIARHKKEITVHPKEKPVLHGLNTFPDTSQKSKGAPFSGDELVNPIVGKSKPDIDTENFRVSNNLSPADNKIIFKDVKNIKIFVDFASGLPSCCTGTRVSAIIIGTDRNIMEKNISPSFSLPQFDCNSPKFTLENVVKGYSITILILFT
jgi:hypothetical protein